MANLDISFRSRDSQYYHQRAAHLVQIKAVTPQSIQSEAYQLKGSLEQQTNQLLRSWDIEQGNLSIVKSKILTSTLKTRSSWKGCYPSIAESQNGLGLPEATQGFSFITIQQFQAMQIRDPAGVLQAYRFPVPTNVITNLSSATTALPSLDRGKATSGSSDPLARGSYDQRHYAVWAEYGNKPAYSRELAKDGLSGLDWVENIRHTSAFVNKVVQLELPEQYVKGTNKDLARALRSVEVPKGLPTPLASPFQSFHGVCINRGISNDDSQIHFDNLDEKNTSNLVIPFGVFTGAHLILWQLKMIIELPSGWGILFPGSLLAHNLTTVYGERNSVDFFIHKALYDWLQRQNLSNPFVQKKKNAAIAYGTQKTGRQGKTTAKIQKKRKNMKGKLAETKARQRDAVVNMANRCRN